MLPSELKGAAHGSVVVDSTGGKATMPTCTLGGLRMPSIVRTPSLALLRSVHVPSGVAGWHIEPVRSIAITRSTGLDEHGLQALACADTSKWSMPNRPANQAFVLALPVTTIAFGLTEGLQPAATTEVFVHFAVYSKSKLARFGGLFASPYSWAVWNANVAFGRSWAPASAAASTALCNWRLA